MRYRRQAIAALRVKRGDTVLDVACGTGINFDELQRRVGLEGRIVGIDLSREMLDRARERVSRNGWRNITLIESAIDVAEIPHPVDGALFSLTHDVMRSRAAVDNVWAALKSGGRVSVFGPKWAPRWALPVNAVLAILVRPYITTYEGLDRPWSHLQGIAPSVLVRSALFDAFYFAVAEKP